MSERLKGKIGIVTGAGTGIGRACAIALAREGAQVALVGRRRDRVEEVTDEIGVSAFLPSRSQPTFPERAKLNASWMRP